MGFINLISIENKKLWKRLSSKIMLLMIVLLVIAVPSMMKIYTGKQSNQNTTQAAANWKDSVKQDLAVQEKALSEAEKSDSKSMRMNIGSLKKTVAEDKYQLEHNIAPDNGKNIWQTVIDIDSSTKYGLFIALMVIIACTGSVAGEFSEGTMKMMISRPYKRGEILTAKLIASILYGLTLMIVTLVLNFVMVGALFGFDGISSKQMFWTGSKIIYMSGFLKTLCVFGLDFITVIFYTIFAFALSTITRSRSISTGFALFMIILGCDLVRFMGVFFSWAKYLPFATTDFTFIVSSGSMLEGITLCSAIALSAIYLIIMAVGGYVSFAKRDV